MIKRQYSFLQEVPTPSDVVYTPREITRQIIKFLNPTGLCLDPCKGDGAFYDYLPEPKEYCELQEGKNFFDYNKSVDWIITNPPYSKYSAFLDHALTLSPNVSLLVTLNKAFSDGAIAVLDKHKARLVSGMIYGAGNKVGFQWGFAAANYHFQKGYTGDTKMLVGLNQINTFIDSM